VQASSPTTGLGDGSTVNGIAAASVTSVEADLANGDVVRGYGATVGVSRMRPGGSTIPRASR
jgi:hypothetical protein